MAGREHPPRHRDRPGDRHDGSPASTPNEQRRPLVTGLIWAGYRALPCRPGRTGPGNPPHSSPQPFNYPALPARSQRMWPPAAIWRRPARLPIPRCSARCCPVSRPGCRLAGGPGWRPWRWRPAGQGRGCGCRPGGLVHGGPGGRFAGVRREGELVHAGLDQTLQAAQTMPRPSIIRQERRPASHIKGVPLAGLRDPSGWCPGIGSCRCHGSPRLRGRQQGIAGTGHGRGSARRVHDRSWRTSRWVKTPPCCWSRKAYPCSAWI